MPEKVSRILVILVLWHDKQLKDNFNNTTNTKEKKSIWFNKEC